MVASRKFRRCANKSDIGQREEKVGKQDGKKMCKSVLGIAGREYIFILGFTFVSIVCKERGFCSRGEEEGGRRSSRGLSLSLTAAMESVDVEPGTLQPKKRTFKKFTFRGVDLDALLDMSSDELVELFNARIRRRFQRGLKRKSVALIKKLRKAKIDAPSGEKPDPVRTHLRNMVIVPEMIGSVIGVYNGKTFNQVEIKPEMIGHYLGEFSISYKPVKHGRPGIGATHSSRFIPLK